MQDKHGEHSSKQAAPSEKKETDSVPQGGRDFSRLAQFGDLATCGPVAAAEILSQLSSERLNDAIAALHEGRGNAFVAEVMKLYALKVQQP